MRTAACGEAFSSASGDEDASGGAARLETASLLRLSGTLDACEGFEDWLAGARSAPRALPAQMDRLTALRLLCEDDRDRPACQGLEASDMTDGPA